MADYINKNILSESYVHIDVVHLNEEQKKAFANNLMEYTKSRGKFALYEGIVPEIRTRDGSLKVYSSITGTLTQALGNFSSFEEALDHLYVDAKRLADAMILETLFLAKARGKKVLRHEARTGIIWSTKDLFDRIELARNGAEDDAPRAAKKRLTEIFTKVSRLLEVLASVEDIALVKREVHAKIKTLLIPQKVQGSKTATDLTMYKSDLKAIENLLA